MSKTPNHCVRITGPDTRLDEFESNGRPVNPLPAQCPHCSFPDLEFVAGPYLLAKGFASPAETAPAHVGNFLVRDRVRRILEAAVPGACVFHPTAELKSKKPAPWWLAAPKKSLQVPGYKPNPPLCPKCRQPKTGYRCANPKTFDAGLRKFDCGDADVFKGLDWNCAYIAEEKLAETNRYRKQSRLPPLDWSFYGIDAPSHPGRWTRKQLSRDLYFSVRLEQLLKRAKVKGQLVRTLELVKTETTPEDEQWIDEKLQLLAAQGLADVKPVTARKTPARANAWFQSFLMTNARKAAAPVDFAPVEKKAKLTFPQDYKDFISTVGPKSFADLNGAEGLTVRVLPPAKLNFRDYRRGRIPDLDQDQQHIDGVLFATANNGDCFVFDLSAKAPAWPVFRYDHEQNTLEPFAPNFAECIKRFAEHT